MHGWLSWLLLYLLLSSMFMVIWYEIVPEKTPEEQEYEDQEQMEYMRKWREKHGK